MKYKVTVPMLVFVNSNLKLEALEKEVKEGSLEELIVTGKYALLFNESVVETVNYPEEINEGEQQSK